MSDPWKIGRFYNSYATQETAWTQEEKLKELECGFLLWVMERRLW